jgi:uncharacterized membrane protein
MSLDFSTMFDAIFGITIIGILISLAIPIVIIFVIIRFIRNGAVGGGDPAEAELRHRLAAGEIDMAEFEVRLRALRDGNRH